MPNYLRPRVPGATLFVTVALEQRGSDLLMREIDALRAAYLRTMIERRFRIDAVVVLPDHFHMVMSLPPGDADYPTRLRLIKVRFSRETSPGRRRPSHVARRERAVWQRRYWEHHVRDAAERDALVRYCWTNPVKHGLVARAADWPYSSVHRDARAGAADDLA